MGDQTKSTNTLSTSKGWPITGSTMRVFFEAFNKYGEIVLLSYVLIYNAIIYLVLRRGEGGEWPASIAPVCCLLWVLNLRVVWPAGLPRESRQLGAGTQNLAWEEREEDTAWARRYKVRRYIAIGVNSFTVGLGTYEIVRLHGA